MQLAVITDEIDVDVDRSLDVMSEYGVKSAEIRTIWDKNIADAPDEYIDRVKSIVKAHGAQVIGIASPFYKCDLFESAQADGPSGPLHAATPRGLADQIDVLKRCIEIAERLDAPFIRVFTFWRKLDLTPDVLDQIADAFEEPIDLAQAAGVTLLVENEHACLTATGAETASLLEKINSPLVRAVWDPGNAFMAGETPFPYGYEALMPFIAHVHVKDAKSTDYGPVWTVVGEGECRWAEQIKALKEDGYTGYLSLETHYNGHPTKEASSRACLEQLVKLVAQA